MTAAWECRDQSDQSEEYFNHPLRVEKKRLEDENLVLKRLLRENGIRWPSSYAHLQEPALLTRRPSSAPYLPPEIMLQILSSALTSAAPIVDPLCKSKREHLTPIEARRHNQIAIHFLTTCKAYNAEGKKIMWTNNSFIFTSVQAVKNFANVDLAYRRTMKMVTFRIIARYYDDEERVHKLPQDHHIMLSKRVRLQVKKRAKEPTLARRGFRTYAWLQLIDFLEALLPPYDPFMEHPRPRLFPSMERLRIDLVNFGEGICQYPPAHLHDVAAHQLGCSMNELIVTGLPIDETGFCARAELCGMLRDDGLLIDHRPTMVALRSGVRPLLGNHMHFKVVRSMRPARGVQHHHHDDRPDFFDEFPPAPADEGAPKDNPYASCRTIFKRVPIHLDRLDKREWELFDRVSGLPWDDVEDEITMFDYFEDSDDEIGGMICENCGKLHPAAILPDELEDAMYGDD